MNERSNKLFKSICKNLYFYILISIFLTAFISQLILIEQYSIDFPLSDEWDYFDSYRIPVHLDFEWIFRPYNGHRYFHEHLLLWLHYKINSLDFRVHQLTNFIFFNILVFTFLRLARKFSISPSIILIPLILLYSCIIWEIHVWGTCTTFYFFYFFGLWSLYHATLPNTQLKEAAQSSILAVLSIFSFSGGIIFAVVTLAVSFINLLNSQKNDFLKKILINYSPYALVILSIIYWLATYEVCTKFSPPVSIQRYENFIPFFLTHLAGGFGFGWDLTDDHLPTLIGLIYFFIIIFGLFHLAKSDLVNRHNKYFILSSIVASLGVLILVSYGRSNGGVLQALTSRYRLFSLITFPLVFMLFYQKCFSTDLKKILLGLFVLVNLFHWETHCDVFFYKDWFYLRKEAAKCLGKIIKDKDYKGQCQILYHSSVPILPLFEKAQEMGINFSKCFEKN